MTDALLGAKLVEAWTIPRLFRDDWKAYLQVEQVREACRLIVRGRIQAATRPGWDHGEGT